MTATVRAVIFDFGGVIIRGGAAGAAGEEDAPFRRLERQHGLPEGTIWRVHYDNDTWRRLRVGEGTIDAWAAMVESELANLCGAATASAIMADLAEPHEPDFHEGMIPLVERLAQRLKVGLLSNAASDLEERLRNSYGIYSLFHDVVNSATVRMAKPDHRIFHLAASRLGVTPAECFFTDDLAGNVAAAREVGMQAHHFAAYGGLVQALEAAGVAAG